MTRVRDAILKGTEAVVSQQPMQKKYMAKAMAALQDGMRKVSKRFDAFMKEAGLGQTTQVTTLWKPEPWKEEVCCMKGMPCWTGKFADAAARAKLAEALGRFAGELKAVEGTFNDLNVEKEREAQV